MTIGERIKERRKQLGLSVDDIANKLGKNRATVYRYESDEIENLPLTILEPLSKVLDTTPGYLMGWEENFGEYIKRVTEELEEKYKNSKSDIETKSLDRLKAYFYQLNNKGMEEAIKRVKELTYIPLYCRNPSENQVLNAAHAIDGATEEEKKYDEDIMNDDNF